MIPQKYVESSLLHRRMGHRSIPTLLLASENKLWIDTRISFGSDRMCEDCKISTAKRANRGSTPTAEAMNVTRPGQAVTMDIVPNFNKHGLTIATHSPNFLLVCDVFSKFTVLLGMTDKSASTIIDTLLIWMATYQTADAELHTGPLEAIRTDADPVFESQEFLQGCADYKIGLSHAAPRHQEMNGLAERSWKSIRELAFSMMVHAHVGDEFYDFALDHAWKVYNCLPIKGLEKDEVPATPYEMFFGSKPSLDKFRVLFCPIIVGIGDKRGPATDDGEPRPVRHRRNTPERAIRGIHVGIAQRSEGWLCYLPSTNSTVVSNDVTFDEDFETTHVRLDSRTRFTGGIPLQPHPQDVPDDDQAEVIGFTPWPVQRGESESRLPPGISTNSQNSPLYTDVETPEDPAPSLQRQNSNDSALFDNYLDFEDEVQNVWDGTVRWSPTLTETREYLPSQPATAPPPRRSARLQSQEALTLAAAMKVIPQGDELA